MDMSHSNVVVLRTLVVRHFLAKSDCYPHGLRHWSRKSLDFGLPQALLANSGGWGPKFLCETFRRNMIVYARSAFDKAFRTKGTENSHCQIRK